MKKPMFITIIIAASLVLIVGGYFGYKYYWQGRGGTTVTIKYPYEIKVAKLLDPLDENSEKEYAGRITINEQHILSFEAASKYRGELEKAVQEINSKKSLFIDSPPPGATHRGSFSRIVEKENNDWVAAVEENLEKNYGLIKVEND